MKRKRIFKIILRFIGCLLISGSLFIAYWWFYKLLPLRHLADGKWLENHTEKARWEEEQKKYQRLNSSPDLCFSGDRIGYYGDKQNFEWLVEKMQNSKGFRVCGCTETALMFMTNSYEKSWGEWLEKNKNSTQEEWIQNGFNRIGIKVYIPPNSENVEPLLWLMGQKTWDVLFGGPKDEKKTPEAVPSYIKYNTFRWLRDSGFDPLKYSLDHPSIPEDIKLGLIQYKQWNEVFPKRNGIGILFATENRKVEDNDFLRPPPITQAKYITLVYLLIILPFIGGGLLIMFPRKDEERKVEQSASGNGVTAAPKP